MKANEWLKKQGHIKEITRGRMSLVNTGHLQTAYENGTRFSDWPKGKVETTEGVTRVKRAVEENGKEVLELAPFRYTEDVFQAYHYTDGKKVIRSLREACMHCGYSLVGCWCAESRIVTKDGNPDGVVVFVERK